MNRISFDKLDGLLDLEPYAVGHEEKKSHFMDAIRQVTLHHYSSCLPYQRLCDRREFSPDRFNEIEELPYLPTNAAFVLDDSLDKSLKSIVQCLKTGFK